MSPRARVELVGDAGRLQQVFWNLLQNAIKFTPRDGRIRVAVEQVDSHVVVQVRDDGPGIDPELLPHVFDRFKQGMGPDASSQMGLGLGLALVREIVSAHGGEAAAASPGPGLGSTFSVTLPLAGTRGVQGVGAGDGASGARPSADAQPTL